MRTLLATAAAGAATLPAAAGRSAASISQQQLLPTTTQGDDGCGCCCEDAAAAAAQQLEAAAAKKGSVSKKSFRNSAAGAGKVGGPGIGVPPRHNSNRASLLLPQPQQPQPQQPQNPPCFVEDDGEIDCTEHGPANKHGAKNSFGKQKKTVVAAVNAVSGSRTSLRSIGGGEPAGLPRKSLLGVDVTQVGLPRAKKPFRPLWDLEDERRLAAEQCPETAERLGFTVDCKIAPLMPREETGPRKNLRRVTLTWDGMVITIDPVEPKKTKSERAHKSIITLNSAPNAEEPPLQINVGEVPKRFKGSPPKDPSKGAQARKCLHKLLEHKYSVVGRMKGGKNTYDKLRKFILTQCAHHQSNDDAMAAALADDPTRTDMNYFQALRVMALVVVLAGEVQFGWKDDAIGLESLVAETTRNMRFPLVSIQHAAYTPPKDDVLEAEVYGDDEHDDDAGGEQRDQVDGDGPSGVDAGEDYYYNGTGLDGYDEFEQQQYDGPSAGGEGFQRDGPANRRQSSRGGGGFAGMVRTAYDKFGNSKWAWDNFVNLPYIEHVWSSRNIPFDSERAEKFLDFVLFKKQTTWGQ